MTVPLQQFRALPAGLWRSCDNALWTTKLLLRIQHGFLCASSATPPPALLRSMNSKQFAALPFWPLNPWNGACLENLKSRTLDQFLSRRAEDQLMLPLGRLLPGGVVPPGGGRHTPYVMMHFDAEGRTVAGSGERVDLTPAGLHAAIVGQVAGGGRSAG